MLLRRVSFFVLVLGLTVGFSTSSSAFNIGGMVERTAKNTAKGAARGAVQKEYNKRLAKQKCRFVGNSTSEFTGCSIDKIITEISALRTAAESSGFANDVDILVQTYGKNWDTAQRRAEYLRDKIRAQVSYWDYDIRYSKADSNEVYLQVSIR